MATAKKAALKKVAAKKAAAKKAAAPKEDIFEFELNPPPPMSNRAVNAPLLEKLSRSVEKWPEGAAIVIEDVKKTAVMSYLRTEFPQHIWGLAKILGNDKQRRVYLLKKNYVGPPLKRMGPAPKKAASPAGSHHSGNGVSKEEPAEQQG